MTRVPIIVRAAAPFQVSSRTWRRCPRLGGGRRAGVREARALARGSGPLRGCAPSAFPRAPIAALPPRVGPRAAASPGSRPLPGSQRVRFSFTTKSPGHCNPTGGRSGRAARAGAGVPPPGPKVGRERARGRWPATGSRRLDLLVSQLRRRGAEEPVLPKANRKWVTERPGQR